MTWENRPTRRLISLHMAWHAVDVWAVAPAGDGSSAQAVSSCAWLWAAHVVDVMHVHVGGWILVATALLEVAASFNTSFSTS